MWVQTEYRSRFGLLGSMAQELLQAANDRGIEAAAAGGTDDTTLAGRGTFVFFNAPPTVRDLPPGLLAPAGQLRAVQFFVDHPLALHAPVLDALQHGGRIDRLALVMPCRDDAEIATSRWPGLSVAHAPHGVARHALCDESTITEHELAARPADCVVAGWIHSRDEIRQLASILPGSMHNPAFEVAARLVESPTTPFSTAAEDILPGVLSADRQLLVAFWRVVTAITGRERRSSMVEALQGRTLRVYGPPAWQEFCEGTIEYHGEAPYARIARVFGEGRTVLAWAPTQFATGHSERVLLAMASGAVTLAEDKPSFRSEIDPEGQAALTFDGADPATIRASLEVALTDHEEAIERARAARRLVESRHLWAHRLDAILEAASGERRGGDARGRSAHAA